MASSKAQTTCKEAIQRWRAANNNADPAEAKHVSLICQTPSIRKMDASLNTLTNCERLGLSTNAIDQIRPLNLKYLRILSLARNNIKRIEKLDEVAGTLEELWLSYNSIDRLDGLSNLKKLRVLYLSNNNISNFDELLKLRENPALVDLLLVGNKCYETCPPERRRIEVLKRLPNLEILDGSQVTGEEREKAKAEMSGVKLEYKGA